MNLGDRYILQCKFNTINGVTPSNKEKFDMFGYQTLISIGKEYISSNGCAAFSGYLQGDQYFIALWTAHILLDYEDITDELKEQCIEIIARYADSPLSPEVAKEEQEWLNENSR